ncbi:hypothetical protein [Stutzerimonas nitrititolerans]|uniref:hypothetical protein n=1 Tax=Stutzerimonas nitrititolerans TaxID=2482751 RepID=UPI0028B20A83|nr:hypothetical protein [Stutzerimonas nitrititolerans]
MLLKMLSEADKRHFLDLADLLIMADKPLLWEGKTSEELTSSTDLEALTIQRSEQDKKLMTELEESAGMQRGGGELLSGLSLPQIMKQKQKNRYGFSPSDNCLHVTNRLIDALKTYPLIKIEKPEIRIEAALSVLLKLLDGKKYDLPSTPKVILFELLLVALRDGKITSTEIALLKEFQRHHNLEDFTYDDLLEQAEVLNREISKTISIILE